MRRGVWEETDPNTIDTHFSMDGVSLLFGLLLPFLALLQLLLRNRQNLLHFIPPLLALLSLQAALRERNRSVAYVHLRAPFLSRARKPKTLDVLSLGRLKHGIVLKP